MCTSKSPEWFLFSQLVIPHDMHAHIFLSTLELTRLEYVCTCNSKEYYNCRQLFGLNYMYMD